MICELHRYCDKDCPGCVDCDGMKMGECTCKDELIYLAAPYSDEDFEYEWQRYEVQKVIVANMILSGELIYSPIVHSHHVSKVSAAMADYNWYDFGLRMLRRCDRLVVLKLDGWQDSKGVSMEIAEAERLGKPIEYREP